MKKNKYLVFAAIGFELVGLIIVAIFVGEYLISIGKPKYIEAFLILAAFLVWFISLLTKLKNLENDKNKK